jgi:hypothetical protein
MLNRRSFLRNSSVSTVGVYFANGFWLNVFSCIVQRPSEELAGVPVLTCYVIRPDDFLCLRFCFYNLYLRRDELVIQDRNKKAYVLVQLRQQHISEQVQQPSIIVPPGQAEPVDKTWTLDPNCSIVWPTDPAKIYSESVISAFSPITLQVKEERFPFTAESLLDWSRFEVITLDHLTKYAPVQCGTPGLLPIDLSGIYPLHVGTPPVGSTAGQTGNFPDAMCIEAGIPVTFFEAPYKMLLSPRHPESLIIPSPLQAGDIFRHQFGSNAQRIYFQYRLPDRQLIVSALWQNKLQYHISQPAQKKDVVQSPNMKVVGYLSTDDGFHVLPDPSDRKPLAQLISLNDPPRDITTDFFQVSSLGISTFYHYFNLNSCTTSRVGWNQEIALGRDNYVEVIVKAICIRSGLKVIVSKIAERRIELGRSVLLQRYKFKYLEQSKTYPNGMLYNNILMRQITAKATDSFFYPDPLITDMDDTQLPGCFLLLQECGPNFPQGILRLPYTGIDSNNLSHDFHMDMVLVPEHSYNDAAIRTKAVNSLADFIVKYPRNMAVTFDKERIAYGALSPAAGGQVMNQSDMDSIEQNELADNRSTGVFGPSNTAKETRRIYQDVEPIADLDRGDDSTGYNNLILETDEIQFYCSVQLPANGSGTMPFDMQSPVLPKLKYAKAYLSQLEGIETQPQAHFLTYANSYVQHAFDPINNKAKLFLQVLGDDADQLRVQYIKLEDEVNNFQNLVQAKVTSISDLFSRYYQNAGQMVNPDIVISHLSAVKQAITLSEDVNKIANLAAINPALLLRGVHVEIFGGIDLIQILQDYIPLADSPVFQMIQEAGTEVGQVIGTVKDDYDKITKQLEDKTSELQSKIDSAKQFVATTVNTWTDKVNRVTNTVRRLEDLGQQITLKNLAGQAKKLPIYSQLYDLKKSAAQTFQKYLEGAVDAALTELKTEYNKLATVWNSATVQDALTRIIAYKQIIDQVGQQIADIQYIVQLLIKEPGPLISINLQLTMTTSGIQAVINQGGQSPTAALSVLQPLLADGNALIAKLQIDFNTAKTNGSQPDISLPGLYQTLQNKFTSLLAGNLGPAITTDLRPGLLMAAKGLATTLTDASFDLSDFYDHQIYQNNEGPQTVGQTLVTLAVIEAGPKVFGLSDDLAGYFAFLQSSANVLQTQVADLYKLLTDAYKDLVGITQAYIDNATVQANQELNTVMNQISNEIADELSQDTNTLINQVRALQQNAKVKSTFDFFQKIYVAYTKSRDEYAQIFAKAGITTNIPVVPEWNVNPDIDFAAQVRNVVASRLDDLKTGLDSAAQTALVKLKQQVLTTTLVQLVNAQTYANYFNTLYNAIYSEVATDLQSAVDSGRQELLADVPDLQNDIQDFKNQLAGLASQISNRTIHYTWSTQQFKEIDLGILTFQPNQQSLPTQLSVDVQTAIKFDFNQLPPTIASITNSMKSSLTYFSINFLHILTIDFDGVDFSAQTGQPDQFGVHVRNVHFDGPLNFVQIFQKFLQTLDKGLRFDINLDGVTLGYNLQLPDIPGGTFNFLHASLDISFLLPFKAGVPMQVTFGFSTPQQLFLVSGFIFGGRGCLQIGLQPQQGIVMILLIVEAGCVVDIDLGVAEGEAYIFVGIYIKKQYDQVQISGYLTCGGNLDVLGIVSISVSFYLGLEGNGKYLEGYCSLSVSIDICAFVSISVTLSMYKRIYGCPDNNTTPDNVPSSGDDEDDDGRDNSGNGGPNFLSANLPHGPNTMGTLPNPLPGPVTGKDIRPNVLKIEGQKERWEKYFGAYYHSR